MDSNNISIYLGKFKHLLAADVFVKEAVVVSIKKIIGVSVDKKKVSIREGTVHIQSSPTLRNEVYMKKALILEELERSLKRTMKDIR